MSATLVSNLGWYPASWRGHPVRQMPAYADEDADLGDGAQPGDELTADGRRRRRRRGGRGRGRGRRPEDGLIGEDGGQSGFAG